jgi:hypothetical protein
MSDLAGFAWMHQVIARDDAGRDRQRAQFGGADADDRVVCSMIEAPPPLAHHADKVLYIH